jgi:hypothetical protein
MYLLKLEESGSIHARSIYWSWKNQIALVPDLSTEAKEADDIIAW